MQPEDRREIDLLLQCARHTRIALFGIWPELIYLHTCLQQTSSYLLVTPKRLQIVVRCQAIGQYTYPHAALYRFLQHLQPFIRHYQVRCLYIDGILCSIHQLSKLCQGIAATMHTLAFILPGRIRNERHAICPHQLT